MSEISQHIEKYDLANQLGQGHAGEVWKGYHSKSGRDVAIKIFHPDLLQSDPHFLHYFLQQKDQLLLLEHPNIIKIRDINIERAENSTGIIAYMVQDYIEGQTLAQYVQMTARQGMLPPVSEVVYLLMCVGSAIDHAHQQGVIHGDIKPTNIMLDQQNRSQSPNGEPMLGDFGMANLPGYLRSNEKPFYISTEQAQGHAATAASDIYALGVVLYEIFTGKLPFQGSTQASILKQHMTVLPSPPLLINPTIPYSLSEAILRAIDKNPHARYATASQLMAAVAEACSNNEAIRLLSSTSKTRAYTTSGPLPADNESPKPRFTTILGVAMPVTDSSPDNSSQFIMPGQEDWQQSTNAPRDAQAFRDISFQIPESKQTRKIPQIEPAASSEQSAMFNRADQTSGKIATPGSNLAPQNAPAQQFDQSATGVYPPVQAQQPTMRTSSGLLGGSMFKPTGTNMPEQTSPPSTPDLLSMIDPPTRPFAFQQPPPTPVTGGANQDFNYDRSALSYGSPQQNQYNQQTPYDYQQHFVASAPWSPAAPPPDTLIRKYWRDRKQPRVFLPVLVVLLLLIILFGFIGTNLFKNTAKTANTGIGTPAAVGSVFLQDDPNGQGRADTAHIDLQNISVPPAGKSYYAWFQGKGQPTLSIGKLSVNNGKATLNYNGDTKHTNLLSVADTFIISAENNNATPKAPGKDIVYTGRFDTAMLPVLKSLLTSYASSPNGHGIAVNMLETIKSMNEKAGTIVDYLQANDVDLPTRQAIRIIEMLDGTRYAQKSGDLPDKFATNLNVNVGLLSSPDVPGVIDLLNTQVSKLPPGDPHVQNIHNAVTDLRDWLKSIHDLTVQYLHAKNLRDPAVLQIAQELKKMASDTYTGRIIPPNSGPLPILGSAGAIQAYTECQYLATITVKRA